MSAKQKKRRARAAVQPPSRAAAKEPSPGRFVLWGSLAVVVVAVVLSVVKAPILPVNDPALYEFYGRRLLEGAHLYTDLPEVKLPTLYYVNALLQLAFGQYYVWHTCAEAALNLVAIALFAMILRGYQLSTWAPATALFAVVYSLGISQFDYPEFFAVPLILLAYYLALRRLEVAAGISLAIATTLWVQTPILLLPLLARGLPWSRKARAPLAFLLTFVLAMIAVVPVLGVGWILHPLSTWPGFMQGSVDRITHPSADIWKRLATTFLHVGIAALIALLLLVIRRPRTEAQRFALWWCGCSFVGALIPPSLFPWYFVPFMPAAAMAVAAFGVSRAILVTRFAIAAVFLALAGYAAWMCGEDTAYIDLYASNVDHVGQWIEVALGPRQVLWTTGYLPELFLASGAVEAAPGASNHAPPVFAEPGSSAGLQLTHWARVPDVIAEGSPSAVPEARARFYLMDPKSRATADYEPICRNALGLRIRLYGTPKTAELLGRRLNGC